MSNLSVQLIGKLREFSWEKESWFPAVLPTLEQVSSQEAAWQPEHGGNSIWQIVHHMNYYNEYILSKLGAYQGSFQLTNQETFQQPGDPQDRAGWEETHRKVRDIHEQLNAVLANLTDADLTKNQLGESLAAWVMHDAYHVGQIVLLLRAQGKWVSR